MKSCSRCNCMCCIRFALPTAAAAARRHCHSMWVSEYMGILYFLLLICVFVQFALLQINQFYRHFQLFHSRPMSRCTFIYEYAFACLSVFDERFFFWCWLNENFSISNEFTTVWPVFHVYKCVCRFLYTQARIHSYYSNLFEWLYFHYERSDQTTETTNRINNIRTPNSLASWVSEWDCVSVVGLMGLYFIHKFTCVVH